MYKLKKDILVHPLPVPTDLHECRYLSFGLLPLDIYNQIFSVAIYIQDGWMLTEGDVVPMYITFENNTYYCVDYVWDNENHYTYMNFIINLFEFEYEMIDF
jgi:hypothetical protein